ncbi:MAG: hypothetical protein NFCOHLIN_01068 [Gammaproteobacteria bacterium]|nr:hypothetical protein [Gammaproteobacteria bacterium]
MRLPFKIFAWDYLGRGVADRMNGVNSRNNYVYRLVHGVKDATMRVRDHGGPMSELGSALSRLRDRLQDTRDHPDAVGAPHRTRQINYRRL